MGLSVDERLEGSKVLSRLVARYWGFWPRMLALDERVGEAPRSPEVDETVGGMPTEVRKGERGVVAE